MLSPSFALAGMGSPTQSQWRWAFTATKGEMLNAQEHCVHLTLCIVIPRELSLALVHGIQVHGYFVRLARATWCLGGKGCRIWTDRGIGGMVCVCSRDERETAGSWAVGLFLFHPWATCQSLDTEDERGWREREQESEERADASEKILTKMQGCWQKLDVRSFKR